MNICDRASNPLHRIVIPYGSFVASTVDIQEYRHAFVMIPHERGDQE